jgi:hypothetical protein
VFPLDGGHGVVLNTAFARGQVESGDREDV